MPSSTSDHYPVDDINRLRRRHQRAAYDRATVHTLLDAAALCHVSYVIDGLPFCTPTLFWRADETLYWHGSSASRMLRSLESGVPACLTVTHLDSLVLARSAFHHSADYRSVMAFGHARLVTDAQHKAQAMVHMVDRLFPGRTAGLRPTTALEMKATSVIAMPIERASAKIRTGGVIDDDEDYALPIWAERIPVRQVIGAPEPCARVQDGVPRPAGLEGYRDQRPLEQALTQAHQVTFAR